MSTSDKDVGSVLSTSDCTEVKQEKARAGVFFNMSPNCNLAQWKSGERPLVVCGTAYDARSFSKFVYQSACDMHGVGTRAAFAARSFSFTLVKVSANLKVLSEMHGSGSGKAVSAAVLLERGEEIWSELGDALWTCSTTLLSGRTAHKLIDEKVEVFLRMILDPFEPGRICEEFTRKGTSWNKMCEAYFTGKSGNQVRRFGSGRARN
jgi:hypothetical protein